MRILTAAQMREVDRRSAQEFGVPFLALMENAGAAVARHILERYPNSQPIAVVCGAGNNAGDGLVAARLLAEAGCKVTLLQPELRKPLSGDAGVMRGKCGLPVVTLRSPAEWESAFAGVELIVDALLGTGFRPPLDESFAAAIQAMNRVDAMVVSVDVPSGVKADDHRVGEGQHVEPDSVITFSAWKPVHLDLSRDIPVEMVDIGSPEAAFSEIPMVHSITPEDCREVLQARRPDAHKGDFGHLLVCGGSLGKAGAAAMAAMAALRSGVGLVTAAVPAQTLSTVASFAPELMTEPLPETASGAISLLTLEHIRERNLLEGKDVLVIGPGISREGESSQVVRSLLERAQVPVILDADGINAFENVPEKLRANGKTLVITPHPGEMGRLTKRSAQQVNERRLELAQEFAALSGCIVVLKGHHTVIAEPQGATWINSTGNPGMATAGTGDILSGVMGAFLARTKDPVRAVIAAVYLHGLAGDIAAAQTGEIGMTATDLLMALPMAFTQCAEEMEELS